MNMVVDLCWGLGDQQFVTTPSKLWFKHYMERSASSRRKVKGQKDNARLLKVQEGFVSSWDLSSHSSLASGAKTSRPKGPTFGAWTRGGRKAPQTVLTHAEDDNGHHKLLSHTQRMTIKPNFSPHQPQINLGPQLRVLKEGVLRRGGLIFTLKTMRTTRTTSEWWFCWSPPIWKYCIFGCFKKTWGPRDFVSENHPWSNPLSFGALRDWYILVPQRIMKEKPTPKHKLFLELLVQTGPLFPGF